MEGAGCGRDSHAVAPVEESGYVDLLGALYDTGSEDPGFYG